MNPENIEKHNTEKREKPNSRQVEIYMVRHGKQEKYEDPHSKLSAEGEQEGKDFADSLLEENRNEKEVVIKVKKSGESRASRTGEVIAQELNDKIEQLGLKNIKVLTSRDAVALKTTGALGKIMKKGIKYEDSVDEWLENSERYPDAKQPDEASAQIKSMIDSADYLAKHINQEGPKIIYVWVTHETGHASLLNELTGKNTKELGGGIEHLEPMKISVSPDKDPKISFRGQDYTLSINKDDTD